MSNLHPDTQECLPKVCRLAAFVPVNIPIMIMISLMPQTRLVVISSQSLNQTYNFVFNYANRNASNSFSNLQIAMAYSGAVGTAVVVSLNLPTVAQKLPVPAKAKALLITAAPFFGIVSANVFNLFFSRFKDFSNGINVSGVLKNGTKEELKEKSLIAAKKAFILTGIIRAAVPVPIFFLPKIAQYAIEKRGLYPKNSVGTLLINTAISGVCLYMGLSACISFFPQNIEVTPLEMEPVFQTLKDSNNLPYHGFSFNKGL